MVLANRDDDPMEHLTSLFASNWFGNQSNFTSLNPNIPNSIASKLEHRDKTTLDGINTLTDTNRNTFLPNFKRERQIGEIKKKLMTIEGNFTFI